MDELTEEEKNLLERLRKPKYTFKDVEQKIEEYRKKESIYCKCFGQWVCDECHFKVDNDE